VEAANGHHREAVDALEGARASGELDRAGARLLIDLYASDSNYAAVTAVAVETAEILGAGDVQQIARALEEAGESELAGRLAGGALSRPHGSLRPDTHGQRLLGDPEGHARPVR